MFAAGMTHTEIARELGITPGTSSSLLSKVYYALRIRGSYGEMRLQLGALILEADLREAANLLLPEMRATLREVLVVCERIDETLAEMPEGMPTKLLHHRLAVAIGAAREQLDRSAAGRVRRAA